MYICYDLHQYQILVQSNTREVHIFLHTSIVELNLPYNSTSRKYTVITSSKAFYTYSRKDFPFKTGVHFQSYYHYIKVITLYKHRSTECKTKEFLGKTAIYSSIYDNLVELFAVCLM